jgi:hypothetical protein
MKKEYMTNNDRFQTTFEHLKAIIQPFAAHLVVETDTPGNYYLNTPYIARLKKAMFFGAVQIKKNYVSYHLMPVYVFPALLEGISPELKKRMQGKSCFNFTRVDPALLDELARLTGQSFEAFKQEYAL